MKKPVKRNVKRWKLQSAGNNKNITANVNNTNKIELKSIITCPRCGYSKEETMPTDACAHFYSCEKCGTLIKPKEGDCCVFCSYGTVTCPLRQLNDSCCA